jgi:TonB family protein
VEGEEKRDLAAVSPLQQQARLRVPVLVAHGMSDSNVSFSQTKQLVTALNTRGAMVQAAYYRWEGHGISLTADRLDYLRRIATFLEIHNPADGARPEGPREAELVGGSLTAAALLRFRDTKKEPTGSLTLRLKVDVVGRVTDCALEKPSGTAAIDKAACSYAQEELQFRPALGPDGAPKEVGVVRTVRLDETAKTKEPAKKGT